MQGRKATEGERAARALEDDVFHFVETSAATDGAISEWMRRFCTFIAKELAHRYQADPHSAHAFKGSVMGQAVTLRFLSFVQYTQRE